MISKSKWWVLLSGVSLAAMSAAAPAMAQDLLEEIVVTATGRSAAIQDVPVAVQAISNETLEQAGFQSIADLNQLAPTLRIGAGQSTTSGTIALIRGIGTGSDNPGFEASVGIFIDGVYRARAGAALGDLPDVERIEILRGPQGTLFGKNTSAGALSIVTAGPSHDVSVWGELEGAENGGARTSFGVTGPLSDNLAVRLDGALRAQDGYITDVISSRGINDTDRWSLRGQALLDLSESASLRVIVDGSDAQENCCGAVNIQSGAVVGLIGSIYFPGALLPPDPEQRNMTVSPNRSYAENAEDFGMSGELTWDIGGVRLTTVTAYRDWSAERDQDIDFGSFDRAYRDGLEISFENFSEEIRLQGESGRLNWLVGGFLSRENLDTTDRIQFGTDAAAFANAATFFLTAGAGAPRKLYNDAVPLFDPVTFQPLGFTDAQLCALTGGSAPVCTNSAGTGIGALLGIGPPGRDNVLDIYLPSIQAGDGQQADRWGVKTDSIALFSHNEIALSDDLMLTLGARITHETKDMSASLNSRNAGCDVLRTEVLPFDPDGPGPLAAGMNIASIVAAGTGGAADTPFGLACNAVTNTQADVGNQPDGSWADGREETEWSGTASLAYHINDDLMIYGGYSRGYKAGGFNLDRSGFFGPTNQRPYQSLPLSTSALQFEPEFTDAFELGYKSTIHDGTTFFNANLYYQQIHDYQSNSFSGFNFFTLNVPELISQGVEVEFTARPTDNLTLTGGLLYNDAFYDSSATFGTDTITAGTTLSQAPEWTLTGAVNYRLSFGNGYGANFFVNGRYVSDYTTQTLNRNPLTGNDAFALFDARISVGPDSRVWSAELFVRNLTDEFFNVGGLGAPERTLPNSAAGILPAGVTPISAGNYLVYPNAPRTVGLTLRARF